MLKQKVVALLFCVSFITHCAQPPLFLAPKTQMVFQLDWPFTVKHPSFITLKTDADLAKKLNTLYEQGGLPLIEEKALSLLGPLEKIDEVTIQKLLMEISRNADLAQPLMPWVSALLRVIDLPIEDLKWIQLCFSHLLYHPKSWVHFYWVRRLILDIPYTSSDECLRQSRLVIKELDEQAWYIKGWHDFYHVLREKIHSWPDSSDRERVSHLRDTFNALKEKSISLKDLMALEPWFSAQLIKNLYQVLEENNQTASFSPLGLDQLQKLELELNKRYEKNKSEVEENNIEKIFQQRRQKFLELKKRKEVLEPHFPDLGFYYSPYKEEKLSLFEEDLKLKLKADKLFQDSLAKTKKSQKEIETEIAYLIEQLELSGLATWRLAQIKEVWKEEGLSLNQRRELILYIKKEVAQIYDFFNQNYKNKINRLIECLPAKMLKPKFRGEQNQPHFEDMVIAEVIAEEPAIRLLERALNFYEEEMKNSADTDSPESVAQAVHFYSKMDPNIFISPRLFGTKASNLVALTQKGFPIPPGFALSVGCRNSVEDPTFRQFILEQVLKLEQIAERHFSFKLESLSENERQQIQTFRQRFRLKNEEPLHVSVRSGSFVSMPSFLESILDVSDFEELLSAIKTVYASWETPKAKLFRQKNGIAEAWGTAVFIQQMVYGDQSQDSGAGVFLSHDLATKKIRLNGDFQPMTSCETLVGGKSKESIPICRNRGKSQSVEAKNPWLYKQLRSLSEALTLFSKSPIEAEFTVEEGTLYLLQMREVSLVKAKRVLNPSAEHSPIAVGEGAAGGAIQARLLFERGSVQETLEAVQKLHQQMVTAGEQKKKIVLVSEYVTPETAVALLYPEVGGVISSVAVASTHARLVALQQNKTLIAFPSSEMKQENGTLKLKNNSLVEGMQGALLSLDGNLPGNSPTSGHIYLGDVPIKNRNGAALALEAPVLDHEIAL